jgi:diguanylate cyclase (GGDEF)-like protein
MGFALLPVFNIADRVIVAYEVVPRPRHPLDDVALIRDALAAAEFTSPAVLLLPLSSRLLRGTEFSASRAAKAASADPSEVAWILPRELGPGSLTLLLDCVKQLRDAGFLVAAEAEGWGAEVHDRIVAVRPEYLLLDDKATSQLRDDVVAGAELAGLLSFTARLDVHLIARGVDDVPIANALTAAGVQRGSGEHLSPPLVLDPAIAAAGDRIVAQSWFRQHQPRKLEAHGRTQPAPIQILDLPEEHEAAIATDVFAHTLGEAARLLQAEHDPDRILNVVADLLPRVIPMNALAIFEADWDSDSLVPRVLSGDEVGTLSAPYPMSRGITGWAFTRGLPYNCGNTLTHHAAGTVPGTERDQPVESMLVVPLIAGDHRIGVLDVWRDGADSFSDRDLKHCALFAHVTAAAWHNAQLYRQLEERARTDTLTGLHNTRWWDEVAQQEAARSLRSGSEIGVLLLDLDHFKQVNDTGGHAAGDRALRNTARVLRSVVRTADEVIRFGGEEFLILLHDSSAEGAVRVAESIRRAVADMPPAVAGVRVTASIGVAAFPRHGATLEDSVRSADLAMYRAKAEGRDRVILASPAGEAVGVS